MRIYECIYQSGQQPSNSKVLPLVIPNTHPERRELQAYVEAYRRGVHISPDKVGLFSPKFSEKTKISVERFLEFCSQHQNATVCHINPFPHNRYWSYNVWEQGESIHTGLIENSQALLDAVGISICLQSIPRHDAKLAAYCNFWIADQPFWEQYVGGILVPISNFLDTEPDHPASIGILRTTQHTQPAPLLPFMVERLYSTWISLQNGLNIAAYPFDLQNMLDIYCKTDFKRLLVKQMHGMVDECDAQGHFPDPVRRRMSDMCALYSQHLFDYYEQRPHPHTGQPIRRLT